MLEVNGPKFVLVSRSYEPEDRQVAKAKALAWAQALRDGMAATLDIYAGWRLVFQSLMPLFCISVSMAHEGFQLG